jgi:hypothetical protein
MSLGQECRHSGVAEHDMHTVGYDWDRATGRVPTPHFRKQYTLLSNGVLSTTHARLFDAETDEAGNRQSRQRIHVTYGEILQGFGGHQDSRFLIAHFTNPRLELDNSYKLL